VQKKKKKGKTWGGGGVGGNLKNELMGKDIVSLTHKKKRNRAEKYHYSSII